MRTALFRPAYSSLKRGRGTFPKGEGFDTVNNNLSSILTKPPLRGYNGWYIGKSCEEKSTHCEPVREPRQVGGGTAEDAEHGLGAGMPKLREASTGAPVIAF